MKKFAYTIAETLITLSIIGVVGALTLPTFISNHRNQTNAAALSIAVSNLENAVTSYIMKENRTNFRDTDAGNQNVGNAFVAEFEGVFNLERTAKASSIASLYDGQIVKNVMGNNIGANGLIQNQNEYTGLKAKNGVVYFFRRSANGNALPEAQVLSRGGALVDTWASVIIDVNGATKPNAVGRDIFLFDLGNDGILYPCGGLDYSIKNNNYDLQTWRNGGGRWSCANGQITPPGFGCTARLIDENYKPTY